MYKNIKSTGISPLNATGEKYDDDSVLQIITPTAPAYTCRGNNEMTHRGMLNCVFCDNDQASCSRKLLSTVFLLVYYHL